MIAYILASMISFRALLPLKNERLQLYKYCIENFTIGGTFYLLTFIAFSYEDFSRLRSTALCMHLPV